MTLPVHKSVGEEDEQDEDEQNETDEGKDITKTKPRHFVIRGGGGGGGLLFISSLSIHFLNQ